MILVYGYTHKSVNAEKMGNKISKQARKLPSSKITNPSITNTTVNKQNKIQFQQERTNQDSDHDETMMHMRHESSKNNKNADRIGQVKIEEIPIKLDQNVS